MVRTRASAHGAPVNLGGLVRDAGEPYTGSRAESSLLSFLSCLDQEARAAGKELPLSLLLLWKHVRTADSRVQGHARIITWRLNPKCRNQSGGQVGLEAQTDLEEESSLTG